MGKAALVRIIEGNKKDADEAVAALRLQAKAWRIVAMIACHDQQKGVALSQWLFMHSVPFVDGKAVAELIEEYGAEAEKAGTASGVFAGARVGGRADG